MNLPWIRILVDFWDRPTVVDLEEVNPLHGKRLQRLILEACKCGASGRLAHVQGGTLRPLTAKHLARRLNDDPTELQECIDLCIEMGELALEEGFITVPDPDSYWGPLTAAERKQAQRSRDQHQTESMPSALAPSSDSTAVTPMSRACHDVSHSRDLDNRTEDNRTEEKIYRKEEQTEQDRKGLPPALPEPFEDKSSFPDPEPGVCLAHIASAFEEAMPSSDGSPRRKGDRPRKWRSGDRRKLEEYLAKDGLAPYRDDWSVLALAIRWGLRHMAEDVLAIAKGTRKKPIGKHWPYALRLAGNYAPRSAEEIAKLRANRSLPNPAYERDESFDDP